MCLVNGLSIGGMVYIKGIPYDDIIGVIKDVAETPISNPKAIRAVGAANERIEFQS